MLLWGNILTSTNLNDIIRTRKEDTTMAAKADPKQVMSRDGNKSDSDGKAKALDLAMDQIEKQFGKGAIMHLDGQTKIDVETISTGSLSLDIALGGGIPKGRIIEVYGPESSGKTTLTLHVVAEVQKAGGVAAFIDAEHALDPAYAKRIGVDTEKLLVSQPDSG